METVLTRKQNVITRREVDSKAVFSAWYGIPVTRESKAVPAPIVSLEQHNAFKKPLTATMESNLFAYFDKMQAKLHYPHCIDCKVKETCLHYIGKLDMATAVYSEIREFYCTNCNKQITGKRFTFIKQCIYCRSFALAKRFHTIVDYYISNYKRYRINFKHNTIALQIEVNNGINNIGWRNLVTGLITRNWR